MTKQTDALVEELFHHAGLGPVDAQRAAFTALALANGWSNSRIARRLGITRARVGQKVEKLQQYARADKGKNMPVLCAVMKRAAKMTGARPRPYDQIAFQAKDWDEPEFAAAMLATVALDA